MYEISIISRHAWNATPSEPDVNQLNLPLKNVIIQHTVTSASVDLNWCLRSIKLIQNAHITVNGYSDIGYNFLICGDGSIIEGRGWYIQGAHTKS